MRNIEFIEKSSLFHSYKKILYFRDFDLKSDVKIFFYIHFCRARRALSNHIKYFRKKNFTPLLNYAHLTIVLILLSEEVSRRDTKRHNL